MGNEIVTVLVTNYNTSDFVELSLYALCKLTKHPFVVYILDNGSRKRDYVNLQLVCSKYTNVFLQRKETDLRGSIAHGEALNYLIKKVNTPYFVILDADATFLKKDWDDILINELNPNMPIIGTQAPPPKPQDFPLMFAILSRTKEFKELKINFSPKDSNCGQDTGWELREKYLEKGYKGKLLNYKSTRTYHKGMLKKVICAEYYLKNIDVVFASHFGRGSSKLSGKYTRNNNMKIPFVNALIEVYRYEKSKRLWLNLCKEIIETQSSK